MGTWEYYGTCIYITKMSTAAAVAARLKLKKRIAPEADANEPHPPAAPSAPKLPPSPPDTGDFAEGATVEGNFKGLGDWDEALIVGRNRDGTYTLEYVDVRAGSQRTASSRRVQMC